MRLSDLPAPEVTEGTVLVKAQAAALNPADNALAARTMAQMIPRQYPLVHGRDAAGTVEAIGPGGHQRGGRRRGDRAHAADPPVRLGTLGHHALTATAVTAKPAGLDFTTDAASRPWAAGRFPLAAQLAEPLDSRPAPIWVSPRHQAPRTASKTVEHSADALHHLDWHGPHGPQRR